MGKRKATDEQLVAALMACGTVKKACDTLHISETTFRARMHEEGFQRVYTEARTDLLRNTVNRLSTAATDAVDVIEEVMKSKTANPAVRIQAARWILDYCGKYSDRLTVATSSGVSSVGGIIVSAKELYHEGRLADLIADLKEPANEEILGEFRLGLRDTSEDDALTAALRETAREIDL